MMTCAVTAIVIMMLIEVQIVANEPASRRLRAAGRASAGMSSSTSIGGSVSSASELGARRTYARAGAHGVHSVGPTRAQPGIRRLGMGISDWSPTAGLVGG